MTHRPTQISGTSSPRTGRELAAEVSHPRFSSRTHRTLFISLFLLTAIFSEIDLFSTSVALRLGLSEANTIMIALGNATGLGILGALGITKIIFLAGAGFAALLGIRTSNTSLRTRALIILAFLTIMLFAVSMNNLYWISTSL